MTAKTSSQRDVFRARIILGLAEGLSHEEISQEQGVSLLAIGRWRKRWAAEGLEGLKDAPGRGRTRRRAWFREVGAFGDATTFIKPPLIFRDFGFALRNRNDPRALIGKVAVNEDGTQL